MKWKIARLGEIARVERGKFSVRPRNDPAYYSGTMPFVQTGDISGAQNGVIRTHSQTLNEKGIGVSKVFPKGTLLVSIAANIGDSAILGFESACPDSVIAVTPSSVLSTGFLRYYMSAQQRWLTYLAPSGAQKNINIDFIEDLEIEHPPLPEQQKIADILGTWDEALEKLDALIAAKARRKQALMQQLLTGHRRLPGFNKPWKHVRLDKVFEPLTRKASAKVERALSITAGVGFVDQREKFSRVIAGANLANYVLLKRGEFSYNKGNSNLYPQGCVYRLEEYEEGAVPNVWISFRLRSGKNASDFYKHFFLAGGHNHQLHRLINYGVRNDGLLNLTADNFFTITVPVPEPREQQRIGELFNHLDAELRLLRQQRTAHDHQKRGLMQQLLTGRKRVKT